MIPMPFVLLMFNCYSIYLVIIFVNIIGYKNIITKFYNLVNDLLQSFIINLNNYLRMIDMSMFDRIKDLASKRDKNLKDVAIEIGLSENIFYTWKKSSPKADVIKKVADYFNVSTDYLLGRTDNPIIDSDIPQEATTLAAHIDPSATEEDMKKILEYIDFIQQKYK